MIPTTDTMTEMLTAKVPPGTGKLLSEHPPRLGLSRSELLRRASLAYIQPQPGAEETPSTTSPRYIRAIWVENIP